MDVKVIGPIKEYLKTFNNPDEFNLWYAKNKDEIDKITTHKLNKMYFIDGYRITKIKGVLCLKKSVQKPTENDHSEPDFQHNLDELNCEISEQAQSIEQIKNDIIAIKAAINEIIKNINGE